MGHSGMPWRHGMVYMHGITRRATATMQVGSKRRYKQLYSTQLSFARHYIYLNFDTDEYAYCVRRCVFNLLSKRG